MDVNTTIFITTVVALVTTNLGALYFIGGRLGTEIGGLGRRIDGLDTSLNGRIDHLADSVNGRIDHLSSRMDAMDERLNGRIDTLQGAIADLGTRLTAVEHR